MSRRSRVVSFLLLTSRFELEDAETRLVQVETTRASYESLRPIAGERLFVKPRQVRIFAADA